MDVRDRREKVHTRVEMGYDSGSGCGWEEKPRLGVLGMQASNTPCNCSALQSKISSDPQLVDK